MSIAANSVRRVESAPLTQREPTASPPQTFALTGLLADLRRHGEFDLRTLTYHAEQSDATAGDGYWHASINEARSVLESLIVEVVRLAGTKEIPRPATTSNTPFSNWRRYLVDIGFLEQGESDLLHVVYGLSSAKGSHRGLADEDWSRLARRMVFCAADYVLRRYERQEQNGPRTVVCPRSVKPRPQPKGAGAVWRIFRRVRRWLRLPRI